MKKILSVVAILALGSGTVHATDFTDYGVEIINSATLTYDVSGVTQNVETSNADKFKVDRKVDVTVATTDTINVVVVPKINVTEGAVNNDTKPLTFTVTNNSNGSQDFILNATNLVGGDTLDAGESDTINYTLDLKICVDATCSAGDITGTNIQFDEEATKTYYVFADIPDDAEDGEHASIALTATAVEDGVSVTPMSDHKADADRKDEIDIVFAEAAGASVGDAQYDGRHSVLSAYEVVTAMIDVTKYSCVISDGVSANGKWKRIPGATVRYALDINNTGTAVTQGAILTDTLQTDVTFVSGEIRNAACNCGTPAGAVITGDTVTYVSPNVTANFGEVAGKSHECAYIEVTID